MFVAVGVTELVGVEVGDDPGVEVCDIDGVTELVGVGVLVLV